MFWSENRNVLVRKPLHQQNTGPVNRYDKATNKKMFQHSFLQVRCYTNLMSVLIYARKGQKKPISIENGLYQAQISLNLNKKVYFEPSCTVFDYL